MQAAPATSATVVQVTGVVKEFGTLRVLDGACNADQRYSQRTHEEKGAHFSVRAPVSDEARRQIEHEIGRSQVGERQAAEQHELDGSADAHRNDALHRAPDLPDGPQALGAQGGAMRGTRASEQVAVRPEHERKDNTSGLTVTVYAC